MKRLLMVFLIGFMVFGAHGQQSVDVGFFGGTGTYFGDMTNTKLLKSINPNYGAFMRFNLNPRYALRFNVINGNIGAVGEFDYQPLNPDQNDKYWDFKKNVLDISLLFEFNYFKYIVGENTTPYSTYLFAGVGIQTYGFNIGNIPGSQISPTIPFGLGFKFNLTKRIGMGLEMGLRKTFADKLDNLDDPLTHPDIKGLPVYYTDQYHNNDWTAYTGVHLVYKLIYGNKEWELKTPKKKILDWGIENNSMDKK
jgi:hypothetical protein